MKFSYLFFTLIIINLISCKKENKIDQDLILTKFEGYFWSLDENSIAVIGDQEVNITDSAQHYLDKIKRSQKQNDLYEIWQMRLYLRTGEYDKIIHYNEALIEDGKAEYYAIKGMAYDLTNEYNKAKKYYKKSLEQLNCKEFENEKCLILYVLKTEEYQKLINNDLSSSFLHEVFQNSNNSKKDMIEALNIMLHNNFFDK